jgi:mycothiol synthase
LSATVTEPALPAGYRARPATAADIPAIHRLVAACELAGHGRVETDRGGRALSLYERVGMTVRRSSTVYHHPLAW